MINQVISSIFNQEAEKIVFLPKGLTNDNWLVTINNEQFVIRIPKSDSDQIVNRHHEWAALQIVAPTGLDVPLFHYDSNTGVKVTRYIENLRSFDEEEDENRFSRVANLMKKLHGLNIRSGFKFNPIERLMQYKDNVNKPIFDCQFAFEILHEISKINNPMTLCHNDWVAGNIGLSLTQDYLIDYEYAGDNDPLFDVMSFFTENQIDDPRQRALFYQAYFGTQPTNKLAHDLNLWEIFHHLLWCHWGMMMYESRNEDIYYQIAKQKFEALKKCVAHKKGQV